MELCGFVSNMWGHALHLLQGVQVPGSVLVVDVLVRAFTSIFFMFGGCRNATTGGLSNVALVS